MGKIDYLARSVRNAFAPDRARCQNCGSANSMLIERKAAVTALRRCCECLMMFRTPVDDPEEAADFYNSGAYDGGIATTLPSVEEVERLKAANFAGSERDYTAQIAVLKALGLERGQRLFEFGCSWGYASFQFGQAGFDVLSYDVSRPRRAFGAQHLGVRVVDDFEEWAQASPGSVDAIFSSHVLEHVPSPTKIINLARRALKPGGLFACFVPNGAAACRGALPSWSKQWGEVHPNFLDEVYFNAAVLDRPRLFASTPMTITPDAAAFLRGGVPAALYLNDLRHEELLFAFRT